ncbi:MAG: helix-turn-helix domain-containing protein [Gemmatimonadota bacterium]|nr:helix-turn-helix domain-containing protein [Gemmatimonadota bacterium]
MRGLLRPVRGTTARSLRDICRSQVGLRPKEGQRIQRLHSAVARGLSGLADGDVARRTGYADQAHMIRETRLLLGSTPSEFRARGHAVLSRTSGGRPS